MFLDAERVVAAKISAKAGARKKANQLYVKTAVIIGVDLSVSSIAVAGVAYDSTLKQLRGPEFTVWRWQTNTHYYDRLYDVAKAENYILDVVSLLKVVPETHEIHIAVEEPWPLGMAGRAQSSALKQQAEISGAFLGGLLRYGYRNIFQIPANYWRQVVAADLGITIHHSKWKDPELAGIFNCKPNDTGKFRAKQWALDEVAQSGRWNGEIPDWPDIIESKQGKKPRPEDSKAKAVQCDDRFEALAIMEWMRRTYVHYVKTKDD